MLNDNTQAKGSSLVFAWHGAYVYSCQRSLHMFCKAQRAIPHKSRSLHSPSPLPAPNANWPMSCSRWSVQARCNRTESQHQNCTFKAGEPCRSAQEYNLPHPAAWFTERHQDSAGIMPDCEPRDDYTSHSIIKLRCRFSKTRTVDFHIRSGPMSS